MLSPFSLSSPAVSRRRARRSFSHWEAKHKAERRGDVAVAVVCALVFLSTVAAAIAVLS